MKALAGHSILIVETSIGPFVRNLQRTLEEAGAETLVVRDVETARLRTAELYFTVVVASVEHVAIKDFLDLHTLIYGAAESERNAQSILVRLQRRLGAS